MPIHEGKIEWQWWVFCFSKRRKATKKKAKKIKWTTNKSKIIFSGIKRRKDSQPQNNCFDCIYNLIINNSI